MYLTLRQISYFVEIVDAGSMTRAAARLHVAPTALSQQLKKLEDGLGVRLLRRHSRGVEPTAGGCELYHRGKAILSLVAETELALSGGVPAGQFNLGMSTSAVHLIGVEAALAGQSEGSDCVVHIIEGTRQDLLGRLERNEVDFVLASDVETDDKTNRRHLWDEDLLFVTAKQDARTDGRITLAEALASELVVFDKQAALNGIVAAAAAADGLQFRAVHEVASVDVIRHMVSRGTGTAFMPFGIIAEEALRGEVALHTIAGQRLKRRMSLAWRKNRHRPEDERCILRFADRIAAMYHARATPFTHLL